MRESVQSMNFPAKFTENIRPQNHSTWYKGKGKVKQWIKNTSEATHCLTIRNLINESLGWFTPYQPSHIKTLYAIPLITLEGRMTAAVYFSIVADQVHPAMLQMMVMSALKMIMRPSTVLTNQSLKTARSTVLDVYSKWVFKGCSFPISLFQSFYQCVIRAQ